MKGVMTIRMRTDHTHSHLAAIPVSEPLTTVRPIQRSFPIAEISLLAERESWRKEIFRPIYHIHKWWANRLGSVFRAVTLGAVAEPHQDIWEEFYKKHDFHDKIVLDPFMGSGTTLGEAAKLGARPIGCDINPISTFAVTQSLTYVDAKVLERTFLDIENDVKNKIDNYYTTIDPETDEHIPVLYYFWVKILNTPSGETIPLFSSYVFSKNAYPKKKPDAKIICPECWQINTDRYDTKTLICAQCNNCFNPQQGPVKGRYVTDSQGKTFEIRELLPKGAPPSHKLYAMMALRTNGEKIYLAPQEYDLTLLEQAGEALQRTTLPLPTMAVRPGHNTNQARNYNYLAWRDFFNVRQLLCLGTLLERILQIQDLPVRDQFLCLFSSTLEFNNLFCSFKGEGTGAVRHMFSHHILKPERTPLENNVWGTHKSSGSFATLFKSRLLKAKEYLNDPFELRLEGGGKTYITVSNPIRVQVTNSWHDFSNYLGKALVLNGDSACLPIPDEVVDAVITDPPYFDFIHYSELSDFFFSWLSPVVAERYPFFDRPSSYHEGEVQNKHPHAFAANLSRVFQEVYRILKDDGLLAFSFHHSRPDGWAAIYHALSNACFGVVAVYPVHAEMRVGSPKSQTKEPISIDVILVCKKYHRAFVTNQQETDFRQELGKAGLKLSQADHFNIHASQLLISAAHGGMSASELQQQLATYKSSTSKIYP